MDIVTSHADREDSGRARLASVLTACLLFSLWLAGCTTTYEVSPIPVPQALDHAQSKTVDQVTVTVGILTDEQARSHFGIDLGKEDIQAIWLRIRNASPEKLWLLRNALDPDFYSPDEVALAMSGSIPDADFDRVLQRFRDQSIRVMMKPGMITEGFIFTPRAIGGRYVDVRLGQDIYGVEKARRQARTAGKPEPDAEVLELRFGFAVPLPDGIFDYERLDPEKTYEGRELPDLSREELRAELEALPCCAANSQGHPGGDPLNVVIIGEAADALNSLSRVGWSFTHLITPKSVQRLAGAALSGTSYPVAPVSNLYAFGRKQDFALQRARANISQRNHMRLWLAPFRYRDTPVWVGQVSRDIGIKLTPKSPSLTTHIIDPEVDQTREYLLHSLLAEGFVESFGFARGSRAATREEPAVNLADDHYFSDGLRLVVVLSPDPIPYQKVRSLLWEQSGAPIAEGQTEAAEDNVRAIE